jgi:hypothetical protein
VIDALLYAVRDGIRKAGLNYDQTTCEIMDDGRPPPRCGNFFLSVHDGVIQAKGDNQLDETYNFSTTLTMRLIVPLDRVGDQQMSRNIVRIPLGERQGFYAKADRIRGLLHMNWGFTVLTNQVPPSANDNLSSWATGTVYGFIEPMRFKGMEMPKLAYADWFQAEPLNDEPMGMKATMSFGGCRRMQSQTQVVGPNV